MAIRIPGKTVLDYNNTVEQGAGPASVAGGVAKAFTLPQDTDNIVVKFQASVLGGGVSATLQTTDDGGTTWYDVARTSIVSNANATTAAWLVAPVSGGANTNVVASLVATGSVIAVNLVGGSAAASTLAQQTSSGLPIMGVQGRVFLRYGSAITSVISERVTVTANSQSATA